MSDDRSILHFYRQLIALRSSSKALIYGQYCELMRDHKQVFAYSRTMDQEKWVVLCNMSKEIAHIPVVEDLSGTNIVLSNIDTDHEPQVLLPYEARIISALR
jgi:glycosidase